MTTPATPSKFQFTGCAVRSFHFETNDLSPDQEESTAKAGGWRYEVQLDRAAFPPVATPEEKRVLVDLTLRLTWNPEPGPFTLIATIRGEFVYATDFPNEDAERLCSVHAPALLYAQLRPLVRTHMAEAGYPNVTLPLLNVADTFRARDAAVQTEQGSAAES